MPIRTRFAPSPTGRLHLGHALAAKVARDLAHSEPGGKFLLRFEDIDTPRVRESFYTGIEEDLEWLGLAWDDVPLRQTSRTEAYQAALEILKAKQLVYPCFCTRKEIQQEWSSIAAAPQGPEGPIYPGTCRSLTPAEATRKIHSGIPHAWRLDSLKAHTSTGPLAFHDLRFGVISVNPEFLGDVVLARKDIGTAYHLAVVHSANPAIRITDSAPRRTLLLKSRDHAAYFSARPARPPFPTSS
jgi:glutamyl-Q tRNA(Asp) synthetase